MKPFLSVCLLIFTGCGDETPEPLPKTPTANVQPTAQDQTDKLVSECKAYCEAEAAFQSCVMAGMFCMPPMPPEFCGSCTQTIGNAL